MAVCYIRRRDGNSYKLPVLDAFLPSDKAIMMTLGAVMEATFTVQIAEAGIPDVYTFQWYVNDTAVIGATSDTYTFSDIPTEVAVYSVYCTVTNKGGTVKSRTAVLNVYDFVPAYTYTGESVIAKEATGQDWTITFKTSGQLKFSKLGSGNGLVEMFVMGGGGAGNSTGGYGGGGYYTSESGYQTNTVDTYDITIGAGGKTNGAGGGKTTAFGKTANGGTGAKARSVFGAVYSVRGNPSGSNVYYYSTLKANPSSLGQGPMDLSLSYPNVWATTEDGNGVIRGAYGGYYRCAIIGDPKSYIYAIGDNGEGGNATYIFGKAPQVSGHGTVSGHESYADNTGTGGGGSGSTTAGAFGTGGSGIVVIRNVRNG